jgi:hypothetical protein
MSYYECWSALYINFKRFLFLRKSQKEFHTLLKVGRRRKIIVKFMKLFQYFRDSNNREKDDICNDAMKMKN